MAKLSKVDAAKAAGVSRQTGLDHGVGHFV
jgi:hypothetical protein